MTIKETIGFPLFQVDAFTHTSFKGNPAAVCKLEKHAEDRWMQQVASEMNLSETAFIQEEADGYRLRWFTPTIEVDLCGHATLASAHVLWEEGMVDPKEEIRFYTKSGLLRVVKEKNWIVMDFPAERETQAKAPPNLLEALGTTPKYIGKNRFDFLIEVESEAVLRGLQPDFKRLASVPARGHIVTSLCDSSEYDFVSRFFAPTVGVSEDPVTGSSHCCLAPFWSARLKKETLIGFQASKREGVIRVTVQGERVRIAGQAVTVFRGQLV